MDYLSFNQAHLNYRKISRLVEKVMVFIIPSSVRVGIVPTEIRFPFKGVLVDVYASLGTVGQSKTVIDIEKCSQSDYDTNPAWSSVLIDKLVIDSNSKSSKTSIFPFKFDDNNVIVNEDDHFRVNVLEAGDGAADLTVEVVVSLYIDE